MTLLFLAILLGGYILETVALLLDRKNLHKPVPESIASLWEPDTWQRMRAYTRAKHDLVLVGSAVGMVALLVFWFLGGFNKLDHVVASWHLGPIMGGMVYIGSLLLFSYMLALPFTLYGIFGVEAKFGFNRTSLSTFLADMFKVFVLSILLGGPLLAGVLVLFYHVGPMAWFYAWLGTTAFSLVLQLAVPRWILPLFNRFTPMEEGALRQAILSYTHSIHFPLTDVFEMDGSRRSSKANAFIIGFGKTRRIALFDTLIQNHTVPELVAVLAHEIGHSRKKHIPKFLILGILHTGLLFFLLSFSLTWPALYQGFFMENYSIHAGLVFFGLLIGPVSLVFDIFLKKLSRHFEFEADQFAVNTAPDPEALPSALKTLAKENLSNLTPHPFYVILHHSHPPLLERIVAMERNRG